ncbi:type II toxin-antitoxin system VapC family toxin [Pseudonocardia nigra]|uniref:type II toxin-antitoxin system VapC family toxin n=1 Tax=Pseudonocardia nigra TaxID=1921578 RepID=UPI001C5F2644|nr:PIN domain-containing protein [Pseudonocardia nigra]
MIVVDTGPIVALVNDRDDHHERCRDLLANHPGPLLVPTTVFTEVCLLLERRRGTRAELAFLTDVRAGLFTMLETTSADLDRIAELVEAYADLPLGTVDASVIALAERLGLPAVATLDHRHFGIVRPRHVTAFTLLP